VALKLAPEAEWRETDKCNTRQVARLSGKNPRQSSSSMKIKKQANLKKDQHKLSKPQG
jgi:hypothetical protein